MECLGASVRSISNCAREKDSPPAKYRLKGASNIPQPDLKSRWTQPTKQACLEKYDVQSADPDWEDNLDRRLKRNSLGVLCGGLNLSKQEAMMNCYLAMKMQ